jgi:hypothetical protein
MKTLLHVLLALSFHTGLAEEKKSALPTTTPTPAKQQLTQVRMRFVPGSPSRKGESGGTSFTALGNGPKKGVLWCQANVGIRGPFPVVDKEGVKRFDVLLTEGDDDHVILEIRSKDGAKKIDLPRDKAGSVEVAGVKYELLYPSVSVDGTPDE